MSSSRSTTHEGKSFENSLKEFFKSSSEDEMQRCLMMDKTLKAFNEELAISHVCENTVFLDGQRRQVEYSTISNNQQEGKCITMFTPTKIADSDVDSVQSPGRRAAICFCAAQVESRVNFFLSDQAKISIWIDSEFYNRKPVIEMFQRCNPHITITMSSDNENTNPLQNNVNSDSTCYFICDISKDVHGFIAPRFKCKNIADVFNSPDSIEDGSKKML